MRAEGVDAVAKHRDGAVDPATATVALNGDGLAVGARSLEYRQDLGQDRHRDQQPQSGARAQVDRLEVEPVALELLEAVLDLPAL